jgi:tRNA dimethylallyltransferase
MSDRTFGMELSLDAVGSARAVLIAGPTASGKSALALRLADDLARCGRRAWIVNADAMQVYEGLRVVTARPSEADEKRVLHRLYGHVSPGIRHSVGAWLTDMTGVLGEAEAAGVLPIVVGGTGLYFKALTEGLAAIPDVPADIRARWAARLESEGVAVLHAELAECDPRSAATLRPSDPQRVLRALEVFEATGRSLEQLQQGAPQPPLLPLDNAAAYVLDVDRDILHGRIGQRVDAMMAAGALDEVRALLARGLSPQLPAMKALGVRELSAALTGATPLVNAIETVKMQTRRYSKRQNTWFRHQMPGWRRTRG